MVRKKYRDIANDTKLQEIVSNQGAFEKRPFLRAKHTDAWMSMGGTMVTGTVLTITKIFDFYVLVIKLTPLNFKRNATAVFRPFRCVTRSDTATEVSSLHATMIYGTRSSTLTDRLSTLTAYVANP